jgi:GntR family transcriptional regulator/MocR family aminotransferase
MTAGHLGAHLRRLREACNERRDALRDALSRELPGRVTLSAGDTGQHALVHLPPGADDESVSRRASARGLDAPPLSRYAFGPRPPPGLVLSFAAATPAEIRAGIRLLATCL